MGKFAKLKISKSYLVCVSQNEDSRWHKFLRIYNLQSLLLPDLTSMGAGSAMATHTHPNFTPLSTQTQTWMDRPKNQVVGPILDSEPKMKFGFSSSLGPKCSYYQTQTPNQPNSFDPQFWGTDHCKLGHPSAGLGLAQIPSLQTVSQQASTHPSFHFKDGNLIISKFRKLTKKGLELSLQNQSPCGLESQRQKIKTWVVWKWRKLFIPLYWWLNWLFYEI